MENPKKFKNSMFGYKKKLVNAYIMECAQNSKQIKNELEEKNKALEEKNCELTQRVTTLEKERAYIADALLNAKQEAEKMINEARLETEKIRASLEIELEELRAKIRSEKERVCEIRDDAKNALEEYISRLNNIDIKAEDESTANIDENVDVVEIFEDRSEGENDGDDNGEFEF